MKSVYKNKTSSYTFIGEAMKRTFQVIGIIALLIGSFMYTEEVGTTAKLSDELLNEIKTKSPEYKTKPIEATIKGNTIIPGISGKEVDVKKSYKKMKQIGYFNDKLLVYKSVPVKEGLKNNTDKYIISGNPNEKSVSLIFKVDNHTNINEIIGILDNHKIKATFYITSKYLEQNHNLIIRLLQKGHTIGNLSNNEDYSDSDFVWMKTIITSAATQKYNYCYTEKPDKDILKICDLQNSYTIIPTKVVNKRPFITVKQSLTPGAIISLNVISELKGELENIINYITSKGYSIKPLEKQLSKGI